MKKTNSMKRWTTTQFHTNQVKERKRKTKKRMNMMTYCFPARLDWEFIPKMEKEKCIRYKMLR